MPALSRRLREWAGQNGWTVEKHRAYGEYAGYTFTAYEGQGFKAFALLAPAWGDAGRDELASFLKSKRGELKLREFEVNEDSVIIKIQEAFRHATTAEIEKALQALTGYLADKGISGRRCYFCAQADPDARAAIGDFVTWAHDGCLEQAAADTERARREYALEQKNYAPGALGTLLGGMVASVPWIVVQIFLERIAAILGYLIGVGAFRGYTLLGGRMGRATRWIVAAAALLSVVAAEVVIMAVLMLRNDLPVNEFTIRLLFANSEFRQAWLRELALALFMALLGVAPLFTKLKGDADTVLPQARRIQDYA